MLAPNLAAENGHGRDGGGGNAIFRKGRITEVLHDEPVEAGFDERIRIGEGTFLRSFKCSSSGASGKRAQVHHS